MQSQTDSSATGEAPATPTFEVNDAINYQTIDGFGASLLEAGLVVLNALPPDEQERVLRSLFDLKEGLASAP